MNSATSPVRISTSFKPKAAVASSASASISASAAAGAGGWVRGSGPPHRYRGFGPQAQFLAAGVRGQVKALADVLAGKVEERLRRVPDPGVGPGGARLGQTQQH